MANAQKGKGIGGNGGKVRAKVLTREEFVFELWNVIEKERRRGRSGNKPGKSESMSNGPRTMGSGAGLEAGIHLTNPVIDDDGKLYGQDYETIKRNFKTGWEDEKVWRLMRDYITGSCFQFPVGKYSISYDGRLGIPPKDVDVDSIVGDWVHAGKLHSHPLMIKDGHTRVDINQGQLLDCWLLASMAALSEKPVLFDRVVPQSTQGQSFSEGYTGPFLFRLWWYGEWVEVFGVYCDC